MNRRIRIVCTLLLISGIVSCKKEKDNDSGGNRISKMISWNTGYPSTNISITEFIYDDQKRVVKIATIIGDSANGEIIKRADFKPISFLYNGNNQNPYKSIGSMENLAIANQETYHFYNANGDLIMDSVAGVPPYSGNKKKYYYDSHKLIIERETPGALTEKLKDSFIIADHNLIESYMLMSSWSTYANGYKITYDNKINPISKINIAKVATVISPNGFPSYLAPGFCKNNITKYEAGTSEQPGQFTSSSTYAFSYSYYGNGLPKECRSNTGFNDILIKYYYTK